MSIKRSVRNYKRDLVNLQAYLKVHLLEDLYNSIENKQIIGAFMDDFEDRFPGRDRYEVAFMSTIRHLRRHFNDNFYDFFLFLTDARRVQPVMRDLVNFHKHGPSALPDYMVNSGRFEWHEGAIIELSLIVRGIGKSIYLMARAAWHVSRYNTDKTLVIHGKQDLSTANIAALKTLITNPFLAMVYQDLFHGSIQAYKAAGGAITREHIDIALPRFYFDDIDSDLTGMYKKESTYGAASPKTDETGKHVSKVFGDDLSNEQTSGSAIASADMISYFEGLDGLEEYDSKKPFGKELVGTRWYGNDLYEHIYSLDTASVFSLPIEWTYKETKYYISPAIFDEKKVEEKVKNLGQWAKSQLYMIPRPLVDVQLDLSFDEDHHVITYTAEELKMFRYSMVVTQICDFAYSKKNKKKGDSKSRFTVLTIYRAKGVTYITDIFSSLGERTAETISINTDLAYRNFTDVFIADAQGTQNNLYLDIADALGTAHGDRITCIPHKGGGVSGATGKLEVANNVLRQYFMMDRIKVVLVRGDSAQNERMSLVIDQLAGRDPGLDVVDCLVYGITDVQVEQELLKKSMYTNLYGSTAESLKRKSVRNRKRRVRL